MKKLIVLIWSLILPGISVLNAHPGHGHHDGHMPLHYLTSPVHIASFATIACIAIGIYFYRRSLKQKP